MFNEYWSGKTRTLKGKSEKGGQAGVKQAEKMKEQKQSVGFVCFFLKKKGLEWRDVARWWVKDGSERNGLKEGRQNSWTVWEQRDRRGRGGEPFMWNSSRSIVDTLWPVSLQTHTHACTQPRARTWMCSQKLEKANIAAAIFSPAN